MSAPFPDEDVAHANRLLKTEAELNKLALGLRVHIEAAKNDYAEPLTLIAEFFAAHGDFDIANYIVRLAMALYDLRDGIKDPSLEIKKDRSTQDPTIVQNGRMWVAVAYECLRKMGKSHTDAAKEIARHSALKSLLRGKHASLTTSAKSWHDQFMDNEISNKGVQSSFKSVYKALSLDGNLSPEVCQQRARECLERAVARARAVRDPFRS